MAGTIVSIIFYKIYIFFGEEIEYILDWLDYIRLNAPVCTPPVLFIKDTIWCAHCLDSGLGSLKDFGEGMERPARMMAIGYDDNPLQSVLLAVCPQIVGFVKG